MKNMESIVLIIVVLAAAFFSGFVVGGIYANAVKLYELVKAKTIIEGDLSGIKRIEVLGNNTVILTTVNNVEFKMLGGSKEYRYSVCRFVRDCSEEVKSIKVPIVVIYYANGSKVSVKYETYYVKCAVCTLKYVKEEKTGVVTVSYSGKR